MPAQPQPKTVSPALAALRQLRLRWEEQAARDRALTAVALVADAARTPPLPNLGSARPGAREPITLPPLPAGPDRCPTSCPHCIPASAEGGDGG
jgi:hypothetical protein